MIGGWNPSATTNQSSLSTFKALDLQVAKISGTSFSMAHRMGLVKLDMTTGKSVDETIAYTYTTGSVPTPTRTGSATIYPEHSFSSASGYCYPLNATTASTDCYYIVRSTGASTSTSARFGCSTVNTTEYWNDVTFSGIGYGQCSSQTVQSVRDAKNFVATFAYCGDCQTVTLPWYDEYKMECWGAKGGTVNANALNGNSGTIAGGLGAYVKGNIVMPKSTLYVYVGEQGGDNVKNANLTFNGGGGCYWFKDGTHENDYRKGRGGGSTDIRYTKHTGTDGWSGSTSLNTRIIVAGGGGGASNWTTANSLNSLKGGAAGGLKGYAGVTYDAGANVTYTNAQGGTQSAGGAGWYTATESNSNPGGFGYGGTGTNTYSNGGGFVAGGGSGWYGGGSGGVRPSVVGSAAGGSSFISGHPGCSSISGYTFTSDTTTMIDGQGKSWTTSSQTTGGTVAQMPNPSGGYYASGVGRSGNGYAKITSQ